MSILSDLCAIRPDKSHVAISSYLRLLKNGCTKETELSSKFETREGQPVYCTSARLRGSRLLSALRAVYTQRF